MAKMPRAGTPPAETSRERTAAQPASTRKPSTANHPAKPAARCVVDWTGVAAAYRAAPESGLARAAALQKRVAALRDLAAAARLWIALERQAWDLDGKGDGKLRDDTASLDHQTAFRLLDGEQRAQLRAIAERLAERPAGPDPGPRPAR